MTKLNISMPQELLEVIDEEANALGLTRSGLIQEASARYVAASREDRDAEIRRLRIERAIKRMGEIGAQLGLQGKDAAELVHQARAAEDSRRG